MKNNYIKAVAHLLLALYTDNSEQIVRMCETIIRMTESVALTDEENEVFGHLLEVLEQETAK